MVAGLWWLYSPGVLCLPTITQIKHNIFKPKLVLKIFFKLLFYIILFYFTLTVISLKYAALPSKTGVRVLFKSQIVELHLAGNLEIWSPAQNHNFRKCIFEWIPPPPPTFIITKRGRMLQLVSGSQIICCGSAVQKTLHSLKQTHTCTYKRVTSI